VNRTGLSPYAVTRNLAGAPTWSWKDEHKDVVRFTPLIDDEKNIYFGTLGGRLYKFTADGALVWKHQTQGSIPTVPSLMGGSLFFNRRDGYVLALDMETGRELWASKISNYTGGDTACVFAIDGLVISATQIGAVVIPGSAENNNAVVAVHAANGSHAWTFSHAWPTFNFQASSPGDGTLVFQDRAGGLYRLGLANGSLIWESGIRDRTPPDFSTGAAVVGPNGIVYVASNYRSRGIIHAYALTDGKLLWRNEVGLDVNQAVAVGKLAGSERLSVVAGVGQNPAFPLLAVLIWLSFPATALLALLCCGCCACRWCCGRPCKFCRSALLLLLFVCALPFLLVGYQKLYLALDGRPSWLFFTKELPAALVALDAETGEQRWTYRPPPFIKWACEGDEEWLLARMYNLYVLKEHGDPICLPDSWAQAVIGGDGTAYAGFEDGHLYAVWDADGSGAIDPETEVSRHYFSQGFQASQALAPGLLAVAPCGGGLYVWKS